jgi:hypothetical protein
VGERTRKERRRRKEEKCEKWEKGRGKREEGERKRNVRSGGKEEKLLAVFVSGRRIGQNFSYEVSCCFCFGLEFRNLGLRVWSGAGD